MRSATSARRIPTRLQDDHVIGIFETPVNGNDETSDDFWLRQFQQHRGEYFSKMGVRTRMQTADSTTTELVFELPDRASALPDLSSVLAQIDDSIAHGIDGCAHGRAGVELRAVNGVVEFDVIGTECLRPVVNDAVRGIDVHGKADASTSQTFRW